MSADAAVGLKTRMKPHLVKPKKVWSCSVPGLGRIAYTKDPGEAELFSDHFLRTRLGAVVRDPRGRIIEKHELGSGMVTNLGVLALANDAAWAQVSGVPVNTLGACRWHAWGIGTVAAAKTDFELESYSKPTAATEAPSTATSHEILYEKAGKNQKLKSVGKLEEPSAGPIAITEWGLHSSGKALKPANVTATATSGTTLTGTATPFTESTATVRGEQNNIVWAEKTVEVVGLITKSSTSVLTIPGWIKAKAEVEGTTPEATTKYRFQPMLFDRRVFAAINVSLNNTIEFPWELEIVAGG